MKLISLLTSFLFYVQCAQPQMELKNQEPLEHQLDSKTIQEEEQEVEIVTTRTEIV